MLEIQQWLLYTPARRDEIMDHELAARRWLRSLDLTPLGGHRLGPESGVRWSEHVHNLSAEAQTRLMGRPMGVAGLQRQLDSMDWGGQCWWSTTTSREPIVALLRLAPQAQGWQVSTSCLTEPDVLGHGAALGRAVAELQRMWQATGTDRRPWNVD